MSFSNEKRVFSQSLIAFLQEATDGFESHYDGLRAGTDLNVKFYSILEEKELAIQGKSVLKGDEIIKLGFYITEPDSFTISTYSRSCNKIQHHLYGFLPNNLNMTGYLMKYF